VHEHSWLLALLLLLHTNTVFDYAANAVFKRCQLWLSGGPIGRYIAIPSSQCIHMIHHGRTLAANQRGEIVFEQRPL
jgi:hypothetical protein